MHLVPEIAGIAVGSGGRLGYVRQLDLRLVELGSPEILPETETWLNAPDWIDPNSLPAARGKVEFRTDVDDEQLRALFGSAFCLVAPALDEDYGLTAIEAMRHGLPVITCTDSGHLKYFVEDGVTGLDVNPNGAAISTAVRFLSEHPEKAAEMGACGRERSLEFTWERALREFDVGLEAVLA
jgi:glycosyltransferase involved in cell wall biosynthesis